MLQHREKVLAHAEQQLLSQGKRKSGELLALYKKFLKIENHRLRLKHYAGGGGREIAQQRATLVDIVLRHLYDAACDVSGEGSKAQKLSLVAIGGYGRGELNPYSDVDIMFLHEAALKTIPPQVNEIIQHILYMLWDVGFKVGHSTRSIPGAIKHANSEMLSKTSLLEARMIAGDKELFDQLKEEFEKKCVAGYERQYIEERAKNQAERHAKQGGTVYLQEPNVKNGCGGLRDYQNLLWIAFFKERISGTAGLVEKKLIQESERRQLDRSYDFLLRVRTELHYRSKRANDSLALNLQFQIANKFDYPQKNILRRSESFMKDYYQHARTIFYITEFLSSRLSQNVEEDTGRPGFFKFLAARKKEERHFDGFYSSGGLIYAEARDVFNQDPFRMMRLFQHAQQRRLSLAPELQQLVRRKLRLVDRTFQYARAGRETFTAILSRKGEVGRVLRMMHQLDFLGRYVPEFGQLTCLVQHEFFHRYTADEHTLVCIEKLDSIIDPGNTKLADYRELFLKIEDPFVLYLALLLHDTGKASNAKYHAEASALFAQKVASRLQLTPERRKSLILLVDHHMTLSNTAQRRNLDDPATIAEFANIVRTQANLDSLMLLTLADGQGTGDENWSDWKETLVWQLYRATTNYLEDGEAFYRQRRIEREERRRAVTRKLGAEYADEIESHFQYMPDVYFETHSPPEIVAHIRLFRAFLEERSTSDLHSFAPAIQWVPHPNQGHSEMWVCGWDRREFLAKIAGSLAAVQLNILGADIFTRGDSIVLDIFRVCNTNFQAVTDERDLKQVARILEQALSQEEYDFGPLLEKAKRQRTYRLAQELAFPMRIGIDNDAHPTYTLIDIQAPDRLGLLYHLLMGFGEAGVDIGLSRIATEKGAAIDSFYVTSGDGRKIRQSAQLEKLQRALERAAESAAPGP